MFFLFGFWFTGVTLTNWNNKCAVGIVYRMFGEIILIFATRRIRFHLLFYKIYKLQHMQWWCSEDGVCCLLFDYITITWWTYLGSWLDNWEEI